MTDPTARDLIQRLADALEELSDDDVDVVSILEARAYLAIAAELENN
jgi:hypothetical protein